eukprot:scaffold57179_cov27-Tisochrysis_lutea.AAC.4
MHTVKVKVQQSGSQQGRGERREERGERAGGVRGTNVPGRHARARATCSAALGALALSTSMSLTTVRPFCSRGRESTRAQVRPSLSTPSPEHRC